MAENRLDGRARLHLRTCSAGGVAPPDGTLPDGAQGTVGKLRPLGAASRATDRLGRNLRGLIHCAPAAGRFVPQDLVAGQRGDAGVALGAVQSAAGNQGMHGVSFCRKIRKNS